MTTALTQLGEDLWVVQRPLRFLGLQLGTRMTVARFGDDLWLHSPVAPDETLLHELEDLGTIRWVVGPNKYHHLFMKPWMKLGAEAWGPKGLVKKRSDLEFAGVIGDGDPWPDGLEAYPTSCIPFSDEAVFYHAPSKSLIVTDLLFNMPKTTPAFTKFSMMMAGGYPGASITILEKLLIKRAAAQIDIRRMLEWDIDTVVLAHGDIVEENAEEAFRAAYSWVGLDQMLEK